MPGPPVLDRFVDSLLSSFENRRPGVTDEMTRDRAAGEAFFADIYEKETARLVDTVRTEEPHLAPEARAELVRQVDALIRKVVIPAYARLALPFTRRERNGFFVLPEPLHLLERLLWAGAAMALGAFAVWAPFVPLWEKYWIVPFALGGFFMPGVRRLLSLSRYEAELNSLVAKADREIARVDRAYLMAGEALDQSGHAVAAGLPAGRETS